MIVLSGEYDEYESWEEAEEGDEFERGKYCLVGGLSRWSVWRTCDGINVKHGDFFLYGFVRKLCVVVRFDGAEEDRIISLGIEVVVDIELEL